MFALHLFRRRSFVFCRLEPRRSLLCVPIAINTRTALPSVNLQSPLLELHSILQRTQQNTQNHTAKNTQSHIAKNTQNHTAKNTSENKTQQNTKNVSTNCSTTLVSPFNNAECKGWIVSIIRCRTAPGNGTGRDIGWAAFDQRQGQIQPIPDGVHTHPV